jgi:adenylate cyclase
VEVKNLGDGLMIVFRASSPALSCAVAMQQAVELDGRSEIAAVGLRVGVSAGEVEAEDDDFFGEPVVEAATASRTPAPR